MGWDEISDINRELSDEFSYLFDSNEIDSLEKPKGRLLVREAKRKQILIDRLKELRGVLPEISNGYTYHLISSDNFGSIELLKLINERCKINHIALTTWSYNQELVHLIGDLLSSGAEILFCVDKSIKTRKAYLYAQLAELSIKTNKLTVRTHYQIHSKVTIIEAEQSKISIESSANYSNNTRIENFTITEGLDVYNFHKNWINKIVGK